MDPITIATIALAVIQKGIEIYNAEHAGVLTAAEVLAQLNGLVTGQLTQEATNQAAALAEEAKRFPAEEVTPVPEGK